MSTHVFVFGTGDCGQLGLGEDLDLLDKPRVHSFFENKGIISVVAGGMHSLALDASGAVYSWGCNDEKALGHEGAEYSIGRVDGLPQVVQVAAGDSISAALTSDGKVYTWGTFRDSKGVLGHAREGVIMQDRPTVLEALEGIRFIAAGANHLMAVGADGQLYGWGSGEQGQLGRRVLERHKTRALKPSNVTPKLGRSRVKVTKVVCGSYHSLVFGTVDDSSNLVFSMGLGNFGQLGLGDHEDRLLPELIDPKTWEGAMPLDASAGEHHSLVLCDDGRIFVFGRGDSGQLGIDLEPGVRAINKPKRIDISVAFRFVASGGNHNLAICRDNSLYAWGYGEMGQLGQGTEANEKYPRQVFHKTDMILEACSGGGQHSILLTRDL